MKEANEVDYSDTQVSDLELDSNFSEICGRQKRSGSSPAVMHEGEFVWIDKKLLPPPGSLPEFELLLDDRNIDETQKEAT